MKRDVVCGIYKITNPIGRVYIGQSIDIYKRWGTYNNLHSKAQIFLHRSFLKYGVVGHLFEIIKICHREELNYFEIFYEKLYDSTNPKTGMNLKGCGDGGWMAEESKQKIRKSQIGRTHSEYTKQKIGKSKIGNKNSLGRPVPEERKLRISKKLAGRKRPSDAIQNAINGRKGYRHSKESIEKIRASNNGKIRSEASRKNISIAHLGIKQSQDIIDKRMAYAKKIILNIETGIFYFGTKEAANSMGINVSTLSAKLNGNAKNNTSFIRV